MKKRALAILVCIVMAFSLLLTTALAADVAILVGGIELHSEAGSVVYATTDEDGIVTTDGATAENYNVKWDGSTLTLRNATIMGNSYGVKAEKMTGLSIVLIGKSTVASRDGTYYSANHSYGIYSAGNIAFSGSGTLEAKGGSNTNYDSYGIFCDESITIYDDVTLTARGSDSIQNSFGIRAKSNITMTGGVVTATGGGGISSYGVYADKTFIIKGGSLTAESGASAQQSCGLLGYEALAIEGGVVIASGAKTDDHNYGDGVGIRSYKSVIIKGGTVTASGGNGSAGESSYGVYGDIDVAISGGSLVATGGASGVISCGVFGYQSISISGGDVTATGGMVSSSYYTSGSFGVGSYRSPSISGGSVTATGGMVSGERCESYGVSCGDSVNESVSISGGFVEAKGHTYAFKRLETGYRSPEMCTIMASESIDGALTIVDGDPSSYKRVHISPNVVVGGTNVTDGGYWLNDGKGGITPSGASKESYNVAYKAGVLTLNNANIEKTTVWSNAHAAAICSCAPLTISLVGQSTLISSTKANSYGIYMADNCSLTITGEGSLAATGGTASGGSTNNSYGVYGNSVTFSGGSLIATGGKVNNGYNGNSYGVYADNVTVSGGSHITTGGAASGYNTSNSYGVCGDSVTVTDGSLAATGGTAGGSGDTSSIINSYGVYGGSVIVSGGSFAAVGGAASGVSRSRASYGLYVDSAEISGGSLTAASCAAASAVTTCALNKALVLGTDPWYMWKSNTSSSEPTGDYTRSIHSAYNFSSAHKYIMIADATPIPLTITAPTAVGKVYDGSTDAVVTPGAVISGIVGEDAVNVVAAGFFDSKAVGDNKTVTVAYSLTGEDAESYAAPANDTVTASIGKAQLTVIGTTAADKDYDGNTDAAVTVGTVSGIVSGDKVSVTATGTFNSKAVGDDKTVTITYTLTGGDVGNYIAPASESVMASIGKAQLTVIGTTAAYKDYDGNTDATVTVGTVSGIVSGDKVSVTATGVFESEEAGDNKTVTVTYALTGNDVGNYIAPASESVMASIHPTYALTIDLNGGSGRDIRGDYRQGAAIDIDAGAKNGYSFSGWTSSNGCVFADADSTSTTFIMPGGATTITASWKYNGSIPTYYTLSFNTNGGSGLPALNKTYGATIDLSDYVPSKYGYNFDGWYADVELSEKVTSVMLTKSTTLYAKWSIEDPPFEDVTKEDWFYDDVRYVYANRLMIGTDTSTFSPHLETSRGMIVTILYRLAGEPDASDTNVFDDVKPGSYYEKAISWAAENSIVVGMGSGKFAPESAITREQMVSILYRYASFKGYDVNTDADILSYTDAATVSEYAIPAMQWACSAGLLTGDAGKLMPAAGAQRCHTAAILARFLNTVNAQDRQ